MTEHIGDPVLAGACGNRFLNVDRYDSRILPGTACDKAEPAGSDPE